MAGAHFDNQRERRDCPESRACNRDRDWSETLRKDARRAVPNITERDEPPLVAALVHLRDPAHPEFPIDVLEPSHFPAAPVLI